jgi:hypothetical protein
MFWQGCTLKRKEEYSYQKSDTCCAVSVPFGARPHQYSSLLLYSGSKQLLEQYSPFVCLWCTTRRQQQQQQQQQHGSLRA